MTTLAVAAPAAAPAITLTGALILLTFAWITLYGLKYGYGYTLGALLRMLADMTRDIRWIGGKIASTFDAIDHFVQARIANGIDSVELAVAGVWDGLAYVVRETGDAVAAFGSDVHDAIAGLVDGEIPAQVGAATKPIDRRLDRVNKRTSERERAEAIARTRGIDAVNRDLTREELARQRGIDAVTRKLTELVMPRIRALDQTVADVVGFTRRNLAIRMRRLEQILAAGAIGAVAIAAVTRVFPYWQCTNVRGFNRFLCRMPVGMLGDLLSLTVAALVLQDVCRMGRLGQAAARVATPFLLELVAVVDAATNCTSFPKPPALPLNATALPATASPLAL